MTHRLLKSSVSLAAAVAAWWWMPLHAGAQGASAQGGRSASSVSTPRTADGHPDLSGLWTITAARNLVVDAKGNIIANGLARDASPVNSERDATLARRADPNRPVYKPEFWQKVHDLDYNGNEEDPAFSCMAAGVPRMGAPSKIVQTPREIIFLYQAHNIFRLIPTDGRPHDPLKSEDPTLMGDSVAHWEGDTLVIDVVGFVDTSWLDIAGYFHSENLHVTERLTREGDTIRYQATVEDPTVLVKPWVRNPVTLRLNPDPKETLWEDPPCIERDLVHFVTKEHH